MKGLILDNDGGGWGLDLALRAEAAGHDMRYYLPPKSGPYGEGMVNKVKEWEPSMDWAELIVLTNNSVYESALAPYFGMGYPIFGCNAKGAELELDREKGQIVLEENGIDVVPSHTVNSLDDAIALVEETNLAYAIKPCGGSADKALTCVARDAEEAIFMLKRWKSQGLSGQLMLQERVDGVEVGIAGWFGPGGWCSYVEESFEHKKFLVGDLGCNTGEMGTVIRHVKESKLFDMVLEPITDYLHKINYVGDCSVNCIVNELGVPYPLEFTTRLGWPDFCIRQAVLRGDPWEWMADLVNGEDSFSPTEDVALGILLTHADFPGNLDTQEVREGFPLRKLTSDPHYHHWLQVMEGKPGEVMTAGNTIMVVSGCAPTVLKAKNDAYKIAEEVKLPSNLMYRTDIGDRLEKDLPIIQKHGFARGMKWA